MTIIQQTSGKYGARYAREAVQSHSNIDIIYGCDSTGKLVEEWRELYNEVCPGHPFQTFSWLDCWIKSRNRSMSSIFIAIREAAKLKALLPLCTESRWYGCLRLLCLSFPSDTNSQRCGILSKNEDDLSVSLIVEAFRKLFSRFHLCVMPVVEDGSPTFQMLSLLAGSEYYLRVANSFEIPYIYLPTGWTDYLATRTKRFRKRISESHEKAVSLGDVQLQILSSRNDRKEIIERLRNLDSKTWQHKKGVGIFSSRETASFIQKLIADRNLDSFIGFITVNQIDAAYELAIRQDENAYLIKCGYNPALAECRPGVLMQAALIEYLSDRGVTRIELGSGATAEKTRWENGRRQFGNYWLINKNKLRGKMLISFLGLLRVSKLLLLRWDNCKNHKYRKELVCHS